MATYFNPLRRKIGVVTLTVACVFMATWNLAGITLRDSDGDVAFYYTDEFHRNIGDEYRYHLTFHKDHFSINETYREIYVERTFELTYWKATIPLTLLTAWLLLSTPRAK